MFLILSTMTALLECGPIFLGIHLGYGPGRVLTFCLAYQFGNLFPIPFYLNKKALWGTSILSPILLCLAQFSNEEQWFQWGFYFVGFMLLSCTIQSIRAEMKAQTSSVKKRISRVTGFILAPLITYIPLFLLMVCCFTALFALKYIPEKAIRTDHSLSVKKVPRDSCYNIMLWHQLHYFIYAYAMIMHIYRITNNPFLTVTFFACSWLTYLSAEPIAYYLQKTYPKLTGIFSNTPNYIVTILAGHTFLLFILLLLPNVPTIALVILWILTGFGGGTVFAITTLCKYSPAYKKEYLEFTENLGHFAGTAAAVIWTSIFPQKMLHLCYIAGICVMTVIIITMKRKITQK